MQRSTLAYILWRTLGGAFGIAVLLSMAFVLSRFVSLAGLSLT
jgi:hypothetical protein